jgi:hypothetical protein
MTKYRTCTKKQKQKHAHVGQLNSFTHLKALLVLNDRGNRVRRVQLLKHQCIVFDPWCDTFGTPE